MRPAKFLASAICAFPRGQTLDAIGPPFCETVARLPYVSIDPLKLDVATMTEVVPYAAEPCRQAVRGRRKKSCGRNDYDRGGAVADTGSAGAVTFTVEVYATGCVSESGAVVEGQSVRP